MGARAPGDSRRPSELAQRTAAAAEVEHDRTRQVARIGKRLNIAPPGGQKTFGPLREALNLEHRWSRPDDPAGARAQQPSRRACIDAANLRAGLAVEADRREFICDFLLQRVEHGLVRNRAEVAATLMGKGARGSAPGQELRDRP